MVTSIMSVPLVVISRDKVSCATNTQGRNPPIAALDAPSHFPS